ncbi:hypothetical protein E5357_12970 [Hominisplanchenecus murintestinalis]|uniref:Uncharacterized protein n=1 Tax=Hominisplanchenecus murintestinalis TaxID=2941517 RepID=A0AC61QXB8_9FIRM|nr:hypothetical protein [Lachnospiraceae bacterium]NBI75245.1 hypothetical protein [Lachnospiraceae bacterium]RKJ93657.1 hypothetical protein D7Y41_14470 [Anaerotruncus sp. 1XD22-93]TGX97327.1 hypothetical protein E5357_12970 [Hominisplanchenecus murintestinalis]
MKAFIEKLNHYVWKWAKQIRLNKAYPRKTCFIQDTEDYFLTFNYTSVLERVLVSGVEMPFTRVFGISCIKT